MKHHTHKHGIMVELDEELADRPLLYIQQYLGLRDGEEVTIDTEASRGFAQTTVKVRKVCIMPDHPTHECPSRLPVVGEGSRYGLMTVKGWRFRYIAEAVS